MPDLKFKTVSRSNPHDRLMQRAWRNCRAGLAICQRDEAAQQKALEFSACAKPVAPAHMQRWIEILNGHHVKHVRVLFDNEDFFALASQEQAWWDSLIQSAPFAPVLAAKQTSKSKQQKENNEQPTYMKLQQFDHICRAAVAVADVKKFYVFGANAIIPWLAQTGYPIFDFAVAVARLFPITDIVLNNLIMVDIGSQTTREIKNNAAIRKTLIERGIKPENFPPEEDIKKLERRVISENKRPLKQVKKAQALQEEKLRFDFKHSTPTALENATK